MSYRKCLVPLLAVALLLSFGSTAVAQVGACAYPATNTCDPTQISQVSCENLGGVWQGSGWTTCRDCDCDGILDATEVTDCVTACVDDPYTTFTEAQCLDACTDPDGGYDGYPNDCESDVPAGTCCDWTDGSTEAIDDGIDCTDDSCSYAWSGGSAAHGSAAHVENDGLCDDANVCTRNECDAGVGCTFPFRAATYPCDDGLWCTDVDTCDGAGACVGAARDCSDAYGCTDDTCDEDGDACVHTPNDANCDDSNVCTDNVCTLTGCTYPANTDPCDDGDACTTDDTCAAGVCVGGAAPDCSDGNECTRDLCDSGTGCYWTNRGTSFVCDDGLFCTDADHCDGAGTCIGGGATDCSDTFGCTVDSCDEDADACVHTPDDPFCDNGNVCTTDWCDPAAGCQHDNNTEPCDDLDACTLDDTCAAGVCVGGAAPDCDDGNECTGDYCDSATGCEHWNRGTAFACDDGEFCTDADHCDGAGACVGGGATDCSDGYGCTDDTCDEDADACVHTPNDSLCSDDGNVCTDEVCTLTGCTHPFNTEPCDDGDACTTADTCDSGACVGGPPLDCDDGDVCTDDTCYWWSGCAYSYNTADCDDGNVCTPYDWCTAGVCGGHGALDCSTTEPCDVELCDPIDGCYATFQGSLCGDHLGDLVATGSGPIDFLYEHQCFSVEVYVMDSSVAGDGITCSYVDLILGNAGCPLTVEGWTMGPAFPDNQAGYIDLPDEVVDLGGCTIESGVGAGEWVLLATLDVTAPADACTNAPIVISQAAMTASSLLGQGEVAVVSAYGADYIDAVCWGTLYDHSDSSTYINPGDLSMFATAWPPLAYDETYDYDCDGVVGPGDLSYAATAWLKGVCAGGILIPECRLNCGGVAGAMAQDDDGSLRRVEAPPWAPADLIESFGLTVPPADWEGWRLEPADSLTPKDGLRSGKRTRR